MIRSALVGTYAALIVQIAVGLATVPLFVQAFGAERYGYWGALLSVTAYLSLLNLGIAQTVSSRVSTRAHTHKNAVAEIVQLGFRLYARSCLLALAVVVPLAVFCPWARVFHLHGVLGEEAKLAAVCVAVTFVCELPFSVFRSALTGLGKVGVERTIATVALLLRLAAAFAFTRLPVPLWLAVLILSATNFAGHLGCWQYLRFTEGVRVSLWPRLDAEDATTARGFRTTGLWYLLLQITGAIVWGTDTILAGVLIGTSAAARVSVAWRAVTTVLSVGTAVGPALGPLLARRWAMGDTAGVARIGVGSARLVIGLVTVGMLTLWGASDALFGAWLRAPTLVPERDVLACYCAIGIIQGWIVIPEAFVIQSGRHERFAVCTAVEAALNLLLSFVLGKTYGLVGLPLGTLISRIVTSLWFLPAQYTAQSGASRRDYALVIFGASVVPGSLFVAGYAAARWIFGADDAPATALCTVIAALCFCVAYLAVGLPIELRTWLFARRVA